MKNTDNKQPSLKRRNFLLTVGAGSAGAAAVLVGGSPAETLQTVVKKTDDKAAYAATEHINNYYRTTRI